MKVSLLLLSLIALCFLNGCVSQDLAKLRVGMPKEEVLKIMGKPDKVRSEEKTEHLIYRIPQEDLNRAQSARFDRELLKTPDSAKPLQRSNTPSGSIPKADYSSTSLAPLRWGTFIVILENGLVTKFGTERELRKTR